MRLRVCGLLVMWACAAVVSTAVAQGPPPASVVVDAARVELIEQRRPVTGQLVAARRSIVAAQEPGIVIEILVREGDEVKVGDVIAKLDSARATISLAQAKANEAATAALIRQRDAALAQAERDLVRLESAATQRSASQLEIDSALSIRDGAVAGLEQAKALNVAAIQQVAFASERLDDLSVVAPFSGTIVNKRTELGQWIDVGDPVIEMVDMDSIEAVLDVPERFVDRLSIDGASAQVQVSALSTIIEAPITRIVPLADEVSRMFPVRISLVNAERRLRPGMSVTGLIPTGSGAETLTVHKDAIMRDTGGEFVYFNSQGRAATARVRILFGAGDRMAISSSQLPGDAQVIVEGNELLSPGQPLKVQGTLDGGRADGGSDDGEQTGSGQKRGG